MKYWQLNNRVQMWRHCVGH